MVSVLSYLVPAFFVRKDIDSAGKYMAASMEMSQNRLAEIAHEAVAYRLAQTASLLDTLSETISLLFGELSENKPASLWEIGAQILLYDPNLSLIQLTSNQQNILITPQNSSLSTPFWAKLSDQSLLIQIDQTVYHAQKIDSEEGFYFLYTTSKKEDVPFLSYSPISNILKQNKTFNSFYDNLKQEDEIRLLKAYMIKILAESDQKNAPAGILFVKNSYGASLLNKGIFSTHEIDLKSNEASLVRRFFENESHLDLVKKVKSLEKNGSPSALIGFSISRLVQEIAKSSGKPVLITINKEFIQGFSPSGEPILKSQLQLEHEKIFYQNQAYFGDQIEAEGLHINVLTPESQKNKITQYMANLRESLIRNISLILLSVVLLLFLFSLLMLARISKKITSPITHLASAAQKIEEGHYEGVSLPSVAQDEDEVSTLTHAFEKMIISIREREKIRGVLNKVVSKEIASEILESSIDLGGEERVVTILFSDIRGFTSLSEKVEPRILIQELNLYMTRMCRFIDETKGVVDKFVGDEIMALYGAPLEIENPADRAVQAALLMMQDLSLWNLERQKSGKPKITIGIGIHTGKVLSGNMGAENRLNYTVVGSAVNLASRLCTQAKSMQILISQETQNALNHPEHFSLQKLPPILLKGMSQPTIVYKCLA